MRIFMHRMQLLISYIFHRIWKDLLHRSDRAMIYLFIAGSYTPWLQLRHLDGVSVELRLVIYNTNVFLKTNPRVFHSFKDNDLNMILGGLCGSLHYLVSPINNYSMRDSKL